MRRSMVVIVVAVLALPFVVGASRRRAASPPVTLDMHRSFAVTDHAILDGFSFERVMNSLVEQSGVPGMTATRLFQQWFDTQNPKPGRVAADTPHCDDFLIDGKPSFNGFPRHCPTAEGPLATARPFVPPQFFPLAILNRFDMTASDGSNCGQYRLIYARQPTGNFTIPEGPLSADALHVIFEAVLPNPKPEIGLGGCRPVAQFWADLSAVGSIAERRARLEEFFFTGLPGFAPVIHPEHYGRTTGGGIRSFHWSNTAGGNPQFYQFRLEKSCVGAECSLLMEPDVLQNTPLGKLFNATIPEGRRFRENFIEQVKTLAIEDANRSFMDLPREFLVAESDPVDGLPNYLFYGHYFSGLISAEGLEFDRRISAELKRIGSKRQPFEIVVRAASQTCFGCHVTASLAGPVPVPQPFVLFQHVSERRVEQGEAGRRFSISPAMRDVFIPHRMEILRKFLTTNTPPIRSNSTTEQTIGGGRAVQ